MRGSTSVGYDQFETSPEAIEQELRPAVCELRLTDRLKTNYSIDTYYRHSLQHRPTCIARRDFVYRSNGSLANKFECKFGVPIMLLKDAECLRKHSYTISVGFIIF